MFATLLEQLSTIIFTFVVSSNKQIVFHFLFLINFHDNSTTKGDKRGENWKLYFLKLGVHIHRNVYRAYYFEEISLYGG